MYALVLCIALIVTPQNPIDKHAPANNKTHKANTKTDAEPLPAVPTNTPSNEPQAASHSNQHNTGPDDRIYRIEVTPQPESGWFIGYVVATLIIAVINFGMLVVIWRQKNVMAGQLNEMQKAREQTDSLIAQAAAQVEQMKSAGEQTAKLISHAESQVAALQTSANAAKASTDAMRLEQRAWISINKILCKKGDNFSPFRVEIKLGNTGRTPAKRVAAKTEIILEAAGKIPIFTFIDPEGSGQTLIFPNGEQQTYVSADLHANASNIANGKKIIWVYGKVTYQDISNVAHWIKFCFYFEPEDNGFYAHLEHNDIDSNGSF